VAHEYVMLPCVLSLSFAGAARASPPHCRQPCVHCTQPINIPLWHTTSTHQLTQRSFNCWNLC